MSANASQRVLSGMRPTGPLHLGHYHGVLKNWLHLQNEYECFFFVADWHALTTEYTDPKIINENIWDLIIDWLAVGINPAVAKLFIQSRVPEHAELHLLLSMCTPLSWLERVPSYKDQQLKLAHKDLSTYGFLGYPLLQAADILIYKASQVPVGEDQVAHVELAREVARRFNFLYGREPGFAEKALAATKKMSKKTRNLYNNLRLDYQEKGDLEALERARGIINGQLNLSVGDKERLYGYLEGGGRQIFPEPQDLLTDTAKMPGLDGQKMSKSYNNAIRLRENPTVIEKKLKTMQTDPARVRRHDPGDPEKCPVWAWHVVYSEDALKQWVQAGCKSAQIGCIECKKTLLDAVLAEQAPIRERAEGYKQDMDKVYAMVNENCESVREIARETLSEVRQVMGLEKA